MRKAPSDFFTEFKLRLEENRRLYRDESLFSRLDSPWVRLVAPLFGINPWKVMLPMALFLTLALRLVFGQVFSETVLRVLGGR